MRPRLTFRVVFNEDILGMNANLFGANGSGLTVGAPSVTTISATTYDVTFTGVSGSGSLSLTLQADSGVSDNVGNRLLIGRL